jgi:hypothetical protein
MNCGDLASSRANLTINWRQYTLHTDLISELAAELVKSKVDVIYASGDAAIRAA